MTTINSIYSQHAIEELTLLGAGVYFDDTRDPGWARACDTVPASAVRLSCFLPLPQCMNESINQSIDQSMNQSMNQSNKQTNND
jgi:hypothetical protein